MQYLLLVLAFVILVTVLIVTDTWAEALVANAFFWGSGLIGAFLFSIGVVPNSKLAVGIGALVMISLGLILNCVLFYGDWKENRDKPEVYPYVPPSDLERFRAYERFRDYERQHGRFGY